uniref:Uncharacterized protein n=1 Tax=Eutreptiella gymnastica TaxID=73025 RepID=A0A6U7XLF6_9EUGL|mmetsp:Transcript_140960/g.245685  ORF Transcript_140960/g.245685 Transcript_140960/m.245685 type:complete len:105 (+) Transcript_140960:2597-2911(+)
MLRLQATCWPKCCRNQFSHGFHERKLQDSLATICKRCHVALLPPCAAHVANWVVSLFVIHGISQSPKSVVHAGLVQYATMYPMPYIDARPTLKYSQCMKESDFQ